MNHIMVFQSLDGLSLEYPVTLTPKSLPKVMRRPLREPITAAIFNNSECPPNYPKFREYRLMRIQVIDTYIPMYAYFYEETPA